MPHRALRTLRLLGRKVRALLAEAPVATPLFLISAPLLLAAATAGAPWLFTAAASVSYVSDWRITSRSTRLQRVLQSARFGVTVRFLSRQFLTLVLVYRSAAPGELRLLPVAALAFALFYVLQMPHSLLLARIRQVRQLPLSTRNIDLSALHITDAPSPRALNLAFNKVMHADALAIAGVLTALLTASTVPGVAGCGAALLAVLVYDAVLARVLRADRRMPAAGAVVNHIDGWLKDYRPTVVLYFCGMRNSAYQVNMWLDTLAEAGDRPLVLLRERHILDDLAPTHLPVLCLPHADHVMNLDFSSVRTVLYSANVGPNIHMLRMPQATHVFVGHGDSDKLASVNPYAKVYDEVWTAGRAGRDRWAAAAVGVRDEAVVEVGRPQLAGIERESGPRHAGPLTVLYAPTWENWQPSPGATSLIASGERIVEQLLNAPADVRILYKPHPYTGARDPKATAAHERIVEMLRKANSAHRPAEGTGTGRAGTEADQQDAQPRVRKDADDAERSRDSRLTAERAATLRELRLEQDKLYWQSHGPTGHVVISADGPHLYSCFNQCDLLVSDISSVVTDFLASGKPYAIVDGAELGEQEFRRRCTAARGAFVLPPGAEGLDDVVLIAAGLATDGMRPARTELKHYLLGPDEPDSLTRFRTAVQAAQHRPTPAHVRVVEQAPVHADATPQSPVR
ncbi:hypothetical protein [Streptomyces beijiangensis]|nr:hypothetical protein [Streptomyces beijiangensis]